MKKQEVLNSVIDEVKKADFRNIMILIQGCSGSGKSTFAKELHTELDELTDSLYRSKSNFDARGNVIHSYTVSAPCEADYFWMGPRWQLRNTYEFKYEFLDYAHMYCLGEAAYNMNHYGLTIVANTFTSEKSLKPYYRLAKRMNARVILIRMDTEHDDIHMVPAQAKVRMLQQLSQIKDTYKPDYIVDSDE